MIPVLHRAQEKQAPAGIGVEIDVWAIGNGPYAIGCLSHDRPDCFGREGIHHFYPWLKEDVQRAGFRPLYAVNCKSDGLEGLVAAAFDCFGIPRDRWFAFDMSYPSQRAFAKADLPFAERVSEEEPWSGEQCPRKGLVLPTKRIWLDRWTWNDNFAAFTENGPRLPEGAEVHAVSIELHVPSATWFDRQHWWRWLMENVRPASICTDYTDALVDMAKEHGW